MMVIRPATTSDEAGLEGLTQLLGRGLTSLPRDAAAWRKKITRSVKTFASADRSPHVDHFYLFVLEDTEQKQIVGTCQIIGKTAGSTHGHYYHLEQMELPSMLDGSPKREIDVLMPVHRPATMTEVGGLFLDPTVRHQGLSALASFARFLFIACHPQRFCHQIIAEIRGAVDDTHTSPFWNTVGRHFLDVDFQEVMQRVIADPALTSALISPVPIYRFLLSSLIQGILGKAHHLSQIALDRLIAQGFHLTGDIDPFDAGPKVMAEINEINVIGQHQRVRISQIRPLTDTKTRCLVGNDAFAEFRACIAPVSFLDDGSAEIDKSTADALHISANDKIRVYTLKTHSRPHEPNH